MVTPKAYIVETTLASPLSADLALIQPPELEERYALEQFEVGDAFDLVKGYLQSEEEQLDFWLGYRGEADGPDLNDELRAEFLDFHKALELDQDKKNGVVSLTLKTENLKTSKTFKGK